MKKFLSLLCLVLLPTGATASRDSAAGDFYVPSPRELYGSISQPWAGPLAGLKSRLKKNRNYVVWIMLTPKNALDLRSAERFRRFITGHFPFDGSISHNLVAWRCPSAGGAGLEGATGFSGESSGQSRAMLKAGFGLSTFLTVFRDGFLETGASTAKVIAEMEPKNGMVALAFEVGRDQCESMVAYLEDFIFHPSVPYLNFGLTPDPEKFEGGGCVSFAMALLKKAGLFTDLIPHFYRTLYAPTELMGGNLAHPETAKPPALRWLKGLPYRVEINHLLSAPWVATRKAVPLKLLDPELMIYAAKAVKDVYLNGLPPALREVERGELDRTSFGPRTVENKIGVNQFVRFPLDDRFDRQTAKVGSLGRWWALDQQKKGKSIRRVDWLRSAVFVIENN